MSIIHDALKKAEEFKAGKKSEDAGEPSPAVKVAKPAVKKNQASPKVIIFVAVSFMGVIAAIFFGRNTINTLMQKFKGNPVTAITAIEASNINQDPVKIAETQALEQKSVDEKKQGETQKQLDEFASLFEKGNYEEALKSAEELIHAMPTEPAVYNNYGVTLRKLGRNAAATEAYGKALALNPNYAEALNNMAAVYLTNHDYVKAKDLLLKALVVSPSYLDASVHLAIAYEKNDEIEKAKQQYQAFLQKSEGKVDKKIRLQIESRLAGITEH